MGANLNNKPMRINKYYYLLTILLYINLKPFLSHIKQINT